MTHAERYASGSIAIVATRWSSMNDLDSVRTWYGATKPLGLAVRDSHRVARKAERAALVRAERAEGEAAALREQLAQLTVTLRGKTPGTTAGGRRGAS